MDLEVDDQVVYLLERAHDLGHHLKFLKQPVIFIDINEF